MEYDDDDYRPRSKRIQRPTSFPDVCGADIELMLAELSNPIICDESKSSKVWMSKNISYHLLRVAVELSILEFLSFCIAVQAFAFFGIGWDALHYLRTRWYPRIFLRE
jgi:hypothetical protein